MAEGEPGKRTYEVTTSDGKFRMEIPDDWKVTFGPLGVGSKGYNGGVLALRVYESETKQRAVFVNVVSFRDLSFPVLREAKRRPGDKQWFAPRDPYGPLKDHRGPLETGWAPEDEIISSGAPPDEDEDEDNGLTWRKPRVGSVVIGGR